MNLWQELEPYELQLMSLADGLWTAEQSFSVVAWGEQLRLLRWMLAFDSEIAALEHFPRANFRFAWEVIERMQRPLVLLSKVQPWQLRAQRDVAAQYATCLIPELIRRKLIRFDGILPNEERQDTSPLLAGAITISERLSDGDLTTFAVIAQTRVGYTKYLMCLLESGTPKPFSAWMTGQNARS